MKPTPDTTMDEKNVRQFIKSAIDKYADKHMPVDALFWKEAIRLYEANIRADAKLNNIEPIITEDFGGEIQYSNRGMRHREEEEMFELNKGDKVIIIRKIR